MPPSVFVAVADPVGAGFVESMARPGGNLSLVHSALIIALAERHKLPAVYPRRSFVAAGCGRAFRRCLICDRAYALS
jgi:hypothetical protein